MAKRKGALQQRIGSKKTSGPRGTRVGSNPSVFMPRAFTPFQPPKSPPPGWYDPTLDANERASQRGLGDLIEDVDRANLESRNDYNFALERLGTDRTRGGEDYGRSIEELNRRYNNLATQQNEVSRATGNRGGALAQALRKRTENQAFERAPIDTSFARFNQDLDTRQGRLGVEFQRDFDERNLVTLPRAQREATEFGLDTNAQRWFQSKQAGYEPPLKPANERTVKGQTYRVGGRKGPLSQRTYTTTTGEVLSRPEFRARVSGRPLLVDRQGKRPKPKRLTLRG